jgi:putative transcriptional regulator
VHLVTTKEVLEKTLPSADATRLHVYLGYAGWAVGQLEQEVELGAWYIFRGDAATVFDSEPDTLWSRLIRQTELQNASLWPLAQPRLGWSTAR